MSSLKSRLYPNPNKGEYYITFDAMLEKQVVKISLSDAVGKLFSQKFIKIDSEKTFYFKDELANGIYFVKVQMTDGSFDLHKLIIND